MQLVCDGGVGRPVRDKTYDLHLGVGEAAPSGLVAMLLDNSSFHPKPSQCARHAAGVRERFVVGVAVERDIELVDGFRAASKTGQLAAGVLGGTAAVKRLQSA